MTLFPLKQIAQDAIFSHMSSTKRFLCIYNLKILLSQYTPHYESFEIYLFHFIAAGISKKLKVGKTALKKKPGQEMVFIVSLLKEMLSNQNQEKTY